MFPGSCDIHTPTSRTSRTLNRGPSRITYHQRHQRHHPIFPFRLTQHTALPTSNLHILTTPLTPPGRSKPQPLRRPLRRPLLHKAQRNTLRPRRLQAHHRRLARQRCVLPCRFAFPLPIPPRPFSPDRSNLTVGVLPFSTGEHASGSVSTLLTSRAAAAAGHAAGTGTAYARGSAQDGTKHSKAREVGQAQEQGRVSAGQKQSQRVDHLGLEN